MRSPLRFVLAASLLLASSDACRSDAPSPRGSTEAQTANAAVLAPAGDAAQARTPLVADWIERIDLPNGGLAYIAPPVGATEPRPVVFAVHGANDDAGLICSAWRLIADAYPFVVCPAGTTVRKDTYVWTSADAIDKAVDLALAAVRAKFGDYVVRGAAVYAAFSQGANMAGAILGSANRGRFGRAVLTEGGYRAFETAVNAKAFTREGGERVLFTCSQPGCAGAFEASRQQLAHAGASIKIVYSGAYGHSMPPGVRASIHDSLPWVVEALPGWESYGTAAKLTTH